MTSDPKIFPCPCEDGLPDPCTLCLAPASGICGRTGDGRFLVAEGQAVIGGRVVTLAQVHALASRRRDGTIKDVYSECGWNSEWDIDTPPRSMSSVYAIEEAAGDQ